MGDASNTGGYPVEDWEQWGRTHEAVYPSSRWQCYETVKQAGWSEHALAEAKRFSKKIGSAAVMVVFNGIVLTHWGQVERRFMCHSIRKSLLSALYGQAVSQGYIDLDETLGSIPIDDNPPLTDIEKTARISDLLKARSGVYLPAAYESPNMREDRPARGSHVPGSHWHYNNWDFNVLGTVYNLKTGGDVFDAFDRQLAKPMAMQDFLPRHGYYHLEPQNSTHPAYPFRMSARDLARFGLLYLREGKWHNQQLIPSAWIRESTRIYSNGPRYGGYGYLWWIEGEAMAELGAYYAAGVGHRIYVIPRAQLVILHRADTYRNWRRPDPGRGFTKAGRYDPQRQNRAARRAAKADRHSRIGAIERKECFSCGRVGGALRRYQWNQDRLIIRRDEARLEIQSPRHGRFYLTPHSSSEFVMRTWSTGSSSITTNQATRLVCDSGIQARQCRVVRSGRSWHNLSTCLVVEMARFNASPTGSLLLGTANRRILRDESWDVRFRTLDDQSDYIRIIRPDASIFQ